MKRVGTLLPHLLLLLSGPVAGESGINNVEVEDVTYQKGVDIFRSLLEDCLSAFLSVFYSSNFQYSFQRPVGDNSEGSGEGERGTFENDAIWSLFEAFKSSRFVPIDLVRSLFEDVIIEFHHVKQKEETMENLMGELSVQPSDVNEILDFQV